MKINKNKFFIGALLTSSSLGIAGSITGTYAWYSYNTKSPITYSGIATGNSQILQVKMYGEDKEWKSVIPKDEFVAGSSESDYDDIYYAADKLMPVSFNESTTQENLTDSADRFLYPDKFQGMLTKGNPNYTSAGLVKDGHYGFFRSQVFFRCVNSNSLEDDDTVFYKKGIYLSDITLKCTSAGKDISDAVRVVITTSGENYYWVIAPGLSTPSGESSGVGQTNLFGELDLDGDGNKDQGIYVYDEDEEGYVFDRELKYDFEKETIDDKAAKPDIVQCIEDLDDDEVNDKAVYVYDKGAKKYVLDHKLIDEDEEALIELKAAHPDKVQNITYGVQDATEKFFYKDAVLSTFDSKGKLSKEGICFGETKDKNNTFSLVIWVYLQGWATSIKDANIDATFDLGMTFQCESNE